MDRPLAYISMPFTVVCTSGSSGIASHYLNFDLVQSICMSYRIYTTRGFTLGSTPSGETSKSYLIYTEDFGLVRARAQGVRLLASKLRYNLEEYSFLTLSLVRGKEFWRITGAISEFDSNTSSSRIIASVRARVFALVKRLVQGEERNDKLFVALTSLFGEDTATITDAEDALAFEALVLARVLSTLGYLDLKAHVPNDSFAEAKVSRRNLVSAINKALADSHL